MVNIKSIKDYYEPLCQMYPNLPKEDVKRILNFMWRQVFLTCSYGADINVFTSKIKCFFGDLRLDSIAHCRQYINKMTVKLRILYKRRNIQWDGYYYFALTDKEYENYLLQKKQKKRSIYYGNQVLFKIYDECSIRSYDCSYIFKVPIKQDKGFTVYNKDYIASNAKLVTTRDKLKLKDILVSNYKYQFL